MSGPGPVARRISANVKALRMAAGWTQAEFGRRLGLGWSADTAAGAEKGRRVWAADEIAAAAKVFGCDPGDLFAERCSTCHGAPPVGFSCMTCGAEVGR